MALSIFSLFGSIFVDSSEAEKSISKTEEKSNKLSESFINGISTAGKWAAGIATAAGSAAVAIGSAAIGVSTNVDTAMNGFAASTGIAVDELGKYEDAMLNIYNNNFGESLEDIAASMGTIKQIMGDGMGAEELEAMTTNAIMLRDTFDFDVSESVRAANALMDQFGMSGEDAYNMIAQGAQNGLNQNGDLLDVINEYSVHFSQLGLSSTDMFKMLSSGAQKGTFSVDKLGDAVKEFGIRAKDGSDASRAAFEYLGYDADSLFKVFNEGGQDAADMTQIIMDELASMPDSVEKTTAGVALFGTMWEDMGAEAIGALAGFDTELTYTKDALSEINEIKYDDLGSMLEGLKRNFETLLLPLGNALIPMIMQIVQIIQDNMPMIEALIAGLTPIIMELFESLLPPLMELIANFLPPLMDLIGSILPMLSSFLIAIIPIATQIIQAILPIMVELFNKLLPPIMEIANMLLPVLIQLITPLLSLLQPIINLLNPIIQLCMELIVPLVELLNVVLPPLIAIIDFLAKVALAGLQNAFQTIAKIIQNVVNVAVTYVKNQFDIMKNIFSNIVSFIKNVFTGNWRAAFENVKNILSNIFQGMVNVVKTPINVIIGAINGMISGIASGINGVIGALNKLKIDVPDWVTKLTGVSSFGFNISTVNAPQIPYLAEGGTAVESGSAIVGESGAELIDLPQGARVTPLTQNGDPIGYKDMTRKLDTMIDLLSAILKKEGNIQIGETQFVNYVNKSLGALL